MSDTNRSKLYLVKCKGMQTNYTGVAHGIAYVVAFDPQEAYHKVRQNLDERKLGFIHERELESVTLLAEAYDYTDVRIRLFV